MGASVESPRGRTHRVGDEERQKVAEILADHHVAGRLDDETFEDRLGAALTARTSRELGRLLADLPISQPENADEPASKSTRPRIRVPEHVRRRIAAGTLSFGAIALPSWILATTASFDGGLVFFSSMVTGIVGLGVGRLAGWRANRARRSA